VEKMTHISLTTLRKDALWYIRTVQIKHRPG